jgi:neutral/alkaline ceramidase-like enzyme
MKSAARLAAACAVAVVLAWVGTAAQDNKASASAPSRPAWSAGVARVEVTPREPIFMKGYGSRTKPSEGVREPLFVKVLALRDETGATSVLVTSDLHSYTRRMSDTIADAVQKRYGIARDRLILNGSHTHSGPAITGEDYMRPAEHINAEQEAVIRRYTAHLLDQIIDVIGSAVQNLAPAQLSFAQGSAGFGVNRRRIAAGMRHLPEVVDQDVPVLTVRGADGSIRAIVFGYACHATSAPGDYLIGADWPGFAQAALEAANPGATAMFLNGCGADCDPMPRSMEEMPKRHGETMAIAVGQVLRRQMRALTGPLTSAFDYASIPFQTPPTRDELQQRLATDTGMRLRHTQLMLRILDRDGKIYDHYPYPVQAWRFGTGLTLIAVGGETVVDYALRFKAEYGWENTWVAGYSNDVMGYIPSLRVLKEGGYEGGGAMINYGRPGPVAPEVEEVIARKVREVVMRAGGKQ